MRHYAQASGSVRRAKDSVFLEQVVNDRLLLSIDPPGEEEAKERERRRQPVHGGSVPEALRGFKDDLD